MSGLWYLSCLWKWSERKADVIPGLSVRTPTTYKGCIFFFYKIPIVNFHVTSICNNPKVFIEAQLSGNAAKNGYRVRHKAAVPHGKDLRD